MLAPKEALTKARTYLDEVVPEFAELNPKVSEMRLVNNKCWQITFLAYPGEKQATETLADLMRLHRIEKVVSVASEDGSLIALENPSF
jgi:hypothetical protein